MNRRERRAFARQAPKHMRKDIEQALKELPEPEPDPKPSLLEKAGFVVAGPRLWTPNQAE